MLSQEGTVNLAKNFTQELETTRTRADTLPVFSDDYQLWIEQLEKDAFSCTN